MEKVGDIQVVDFGEGVSVRVEVIKVTQMAGYRLVECGCEVVLPTCIDTFSCIVDLTPDDDETASFRVCARVALTRYHARLMDAVNAIEAALDREEGAVPDAP